MEDWMTGNQKHAIRLFREKLYLGRSAAANGALCAIDNRIFTNPDMVKEKLLRDAKLISLYQI